MNNNHLQSLSDIQHVLYINLDARVDRRTKMQVELEKVGLQDKAERFSAVRMPNLGAIGCSMSHLKCLQLAKQRGWPHVLILEDDVEFIDPMLFETQMRTFFSDFSKTNNSWNVLMLSGNCCPPYQTINDACVKVTRCLTTAAYLVDAAYYDTLIKNVLQGVTLLINNKREKHKYAIDVHWMQLQERDEWFLLTPITVTQRADFSDIENVFTDFSQHLLRLH
jgi:GR25 family glycosyltransferase involved in LPS biosynthesis